MKQIRIKIFIIACLLLSFPLVSQGAPPAAPLTTSTLTSATLLAPPQAEAMLQKIARDLGAVRSFDAAFVQEHRLAMFMDVLRARGAMAFAAPDRFRWEIFQPYHSILVFNHDRVARFEERDGTMKYVESGAYDVIRGLMGQMTGWMSGDFKASRESFTLRVLDGKEIVLELVPRSAEMLQYIQKIEVYLSKQPLRTTRIVIREAEQDSIEIRFSQVRENIKLDEKVFDTKAPMPIPPPKFDKGN